MDKSDLTYLLFAGFLLIAGFVIRYFIGRRRFYRRTIGNMQRFTNYNKSLYIPILESIAMIISIVLILGGLFLFGLYFLPRLI